MVRGYLVVALVMMCALSTALAQTAKEPIHFKMQMFRVLEGEKDEYFFAIGQAGYKSLESLKNGIANLPSGSILEWDPGCKRTGKDPLLSSEKDLEEFRRFCEQHGIKLEMGRGG